MMGTISLLEESISGTNWETLQRLDGLFVFYHKQWWCKLQMFYQFKKLNALFNEVTLLIMAVSMVVGSMCGIDSLGNLGERLE